MSDHDHETDSKEIHKAHQNYDIPYSEFKVKIIEDFDKMHEQIESVNQNLQQLFKDKQNELEARYKQEMSKAQTRLRELSESTSEQQLKQRMIEKKQTLQKEREQFLKDSLYFSNKCKKFKVDLDRVCNATNDLQGEIQFLNEQIIYADKHNQKLQEELSKLKDDIRKFDNDANFDEIEDIMQLPNQKQIHKEISEIRGKQLGQGSISQQQENSKQEIVTGVGKYVSPYSKKTLLRGGGVELSDVQKAKEELRKQKEIYEKLNEFLNDPCFQETEFERIFMESVMTVKSRKQTKDKLPAISKNANTSEESSIKRGNESTLDFTTLSDFDFNDFGKRQILEDFLSREEIKRYLYSLIFNTNQNGNRSTISDKNETIDNKNQSIEKDKF